MIYFDNNKQAHGSEIESPLCIVPEDVWREFELLTMGQDCDVTSEGIVDMRVSAKYKAVLQRIHRITKLWLVSQNSQGVFKRGRKHKHRV